MPHWVAQSSISKDSTLRIKAEISETKMCHQSGFPQRILTPNSNISDTWCVYGRWQDRDSCLLGAPQRTPAVHILAKSCKETSRPFRKHCYRKWLYQPWFIAAHFIPEAQKQWTFQESQIYLDTITLEKHCNCHISKCYCMEGNTRLTVEVTQQYTGKSFRTTTWPKQN